MLQSLIKAWENNYISLDVKVLITLLIIIVIENNDEDELNPSISNLSFTEPAYGFFDIDVTCLEAGLQRETNVIRKKNNFSYFPSYDQVNF